MDTGRFRPCCVVVMRKPNGSRPRIESNRALFGPGRIPTEERFRVVGRGFGTEKTDLPSYVETGRRSRPVRRLGPLEKRARGQFTRLLALSALIESIRPGQAGVGSTSNFGYRRDGETKKTGAGAERADDGSGTDRQTGSERFGRPPRPLPGPLGSRPRRNKTILGNAGRGRDRV